MNRVGPIVELTLVGEVHYEGGRLIVGDADVVSRFMASYGGNRQLGELGITLHLLTMSTTEVSPSGNGVFVEGSEP